MSIKNGWLVTATRLFQRAGGRPTLLPATAAIERTTEDLSAVWLLFYINIRGSIYFVRPLSARTTICYRRIVTFPLLFR